MRPFRVDDLRDLTVGEVLQRARRNRHFIATVALVLVVGIWFPGEIILNRALTQALLPDSSVGSAQAVRDDQADAALLASPADRGSKVLGASETSAAGDSLFDFDPGSFFNPGPVSGGGGNGGNDGGGDGGDAPECDAEELLAVTGEAQAALGGVLGENAPDLAGPAREAAGCGASTQATAAVYLLGAVAPFDDPVVLGAVKPLIGPTCGRILNVAIGEALATQQVSPATRHALAFCFAAARYEPPTPEVPAPSTPDGVTPPTPDAPAVTVPGPSDSDVDAPDVVDLPDGADGQPSVDDPGASSR